MIPLSWAFGSDLRVRTRSHFKPRGVPHAFWNPGSAPALALEITSPGGFETYYNDMAAVSSPAEALAIQAKYGITPPACGRMNFTRGKRSSAPEKTRFTAARVVSNRYSIMKAGQGSASELLEGCRPG